LSEFAQARRGGGVLEVKLVGADTCNRYKRMREIVLDEAARTGVLIQLVEETKAEDILKYRTVNLPMLFIGGKKIAQGNPPSRKKVQACLRAR
jgi:hypothetical protein